MKKTALALISLSLVFVMLFALTACGGVGGTYTLEGGNEVLKLSGSNWSMTAEGVTLSGTFDVDGDKIIFNAEIFGEEVAMFEGTIDGNSIVIDGAGTYTK